MFKKYIALALGLSVITNHTFSSYKDPLIIATAAIGGLTGYKIGAFMQIVECVFEEPDHNTINPAAFFTFPQYILTAGSLVLFAVSKNKQGVALTGSYLLGTFLGYKIMEIRLLIAARERAARVK